MLKIGSTLAGACLTALMLMAPSANASPVKFGKSYYEFVNVGEYINWHDAASAALSMSYAGATGYLANVTSEEENNFLAALAPSFDSFTGGWLGIQVNDDFSSQWAFGPEAGEVFSIGQTSTPGHYSNWGGYEPNGPAGEAYGYMQLALASPYVPPFVGHGGWLDAGNNGLGSTSDPVIGYFVEYTPSAVPVPAALPLLATALAGLGLFGWRRKAETTA